MKKNFISVVLGLMVLVFLSSCFHHHDICISISDDEDDYEMEASYQKNKTHAVQVYLNEHLLNNRGSLKTTGEIILDDNTTFYINSYPGELNIKIDKAENSDESFERVREVCENLKIIIEDN